MNLLFRQFGIVDISQPYRLPRSVTGITIHCVECFRYCLSNFVCCFIMIVVCYFVWYIYFWVRKNPFAVQLNDNEKFGNRKSAVGTAAGYGLDGRGVEVRAPVVSRIFSPLNHPPSPLSKYCRWIFHRGKAAKYTSNFQKWKVWIIKPLQIPWSNFLY
jgi:hypothetical protein